MGLIQPIVFTLLALLIHEWSHIFATIYLGGRVEKVRFFPLGFRAKLQGLDVLCPWERYVVYGAGCAANIVVALWAFAVSRLSYFGVPWLEMFALYNLVLCLFNMLPIFPLDGGRMMNQFLGNRLGVLRANRIVLRLGMALYVALLVLGFVQVVLFQYNITLLCAALYIRMENKKLQAALPIEFFVHMSRKKSLPQARLMPLRMVRLPLHATGNQALERLGLDHFTVFLVGEETITEAQVLHMVYYAGQGKRSLRP